MNLSVIGKGLLALFHRVDEAKAIFDIFQSGKKVLSGESASTEKGEQPVKKYTKEDRLEAMIIHRLGALYRMNAQELREFLSKHAEGAQARLDDFFKRNPGIQDRYESVIGRDVWAVLKDGFGIDRSITAPPPQKARGAKAPVPKTEPHPFSDPFLLYHVYLVSLGKETLAGDTGGTEGDAIILLELDKLERATPIDAAKEAAKKAQKISRDFLNGLLDEFNR